jgi:hypothetical protein
MRAFTFGSPASWLDESLNLSRPRQMLHVEDPATFESSIRVPDEHGHPNKRSDEYSSVAYWYQTEPHKPFSILSVEQRTP